MKVLVTGGAGYIGSHAVYELIRQGHQVVVLDNLSTGNIEAIHNDAKFYEGDQRDLNLLDKIFENENIDVVMHFSAKLIVPESVEHPIEYFDNNVNGVSQLLKGMTKHKIKNIVFSSTAAVYGNANKMPIDESDPKNPITPYGSSKLAAEMLIQGAHFAHGINFVIFRYFNVAGADKSGKIGQATKGRKLTHLLPVIIETIEGKRDKMIVFGNDYDTRDGTNIRDYIHVSDLIETHILGAKYAMNGKSNIFNLGSTKGTSVLEMIKAAETVCNKFVNYEIGKRRAGDIAESIASNKKAINELGFKINKSIDEMIASDLKWRKNNPNGFKK